MKKILLVNSHNESCGVHQFGQQVFRCLEGSKDFECVHGKYADPQSFINGLMEYRPTHILLNKHTATLNFIHPALINEIRIKLGIRIMIMPHDEIIQYPKELIDHIFWIDPTLENIGLNSSILGRPIIPLRESFAYNPTKRMTVGFSGWCFSHKRIELLADIFDGMDCYFNIHCAPYPSFKDNEYEDMLAKKFAGKHYKIDNTFKTADELTEFLAQNTINVFPYEDRHVINRGVSSITDFALAARRPFLLSKSNMFRNLNGLLDKYTIYNPDIFACLHDYSTDFAPYWSKWTPEKMQQIVAKAL